MDVNAEVSGGEISADEYVEDLSDSDLGFGGAEEPEDSDSSNINGWEPDYSFKVMDQEREFDDFIKPIVTEENHGAIKDLYEKAYGIDHVKTKYSSLKTENERLGGVEEKYQQQEQSLGYLGNLIKNKDYTNFFKELQIPEQEVLKYSLDRVNYQDLSPDKQQEYDNQSESNRRLYTLEQQVQQNQSQANQDLIQARSTELDGYINSAQYSNIASEFDSRAGQPGSFRNEVIRRGQMAYNSTGQDVPTQQVVDEVVKLYGGQVQTNGMNGTVNPGNVQTQQQNVQSTSQPTIPNFRAGASSPARKLPRSIDDLRKLSASME